MKGFALLLLVAPLLVSSPTWAFTWDQIYDGSQMPNLATPAWTEATTGGSSAVSGGVLRLTDPESWDINNNSFMMGTSGTHYFNNPDDGLNTFSAVTGYGYTLEWRMKVNACSGTPSDSQVGMKLEFGNYPTDKEAKQDWYYDAASRRLANNQYKDGTGLSFPHEGRTGPEGGETVLSQDAFPGIGLGEWHTYRMTYVSFSGQWHRELWLDGAYVGRWWSEKNGSPIGPVIKMRCNNNMTPDSDVEFDFVRWADECQGMHFYTTTPIPEPSSLLALASGLICIGGMALRRRR